MNDRATEAEKLKRINFCITQLNRGWTRHDLCQFAAKKWKVSDRQTDRYIADATKIIAENYASEYPNLTRDTHTRFGEIYKLAMTDGNYQAAISAIREQAKIAGLYP